MLLQLFLLSSQADTVKIRAIPYPPPPAIAIDSVALGTPSLRIPTGRDTALVWLLRAADSVFIVASIPDPTPAWNDDFVLSLDTRGDAATSPQHDDFQLDFGRVLDSSKVFRGKNGRWEPPRADPDWRLGPERSGGGWEVSGHSDPSGWSLVLRLDPAWFKGEGRRRTRVAFRIYSGSPGGWYAWPAPKGNLPPTMVEQSPALWTPVH